MSRRVKLPGADELFGAARPAPEPAPTSASDAAISPASEAAITAESGPPTPTPVPAPAEPAPAVVTELPPSAAKAPSGRVKHDEKITVYVTADELLDLEHTRLQLRRHHGLAVDRGRIVREAIHLALAGVESDGDDSPLVRRLRA